MVLFNLNKHLRVTEEEFRASKPDVSFAPVLKETVLAFYRHAVLHTGTPPVAPMGAKVVDVGEELVDGLWQIRWEIAPQTPEEMQQTLGRLEAYYVEGMQKEMDDQARLRKYDNINSVCTYATSTHPRFGPEGRAAVEYRDEVWEYGTARLQAVLAGIGDILAGTAQLPTLADIVAGMPKIQWQDPRARVAMEPVAGEGVSSVAVEVVQDLIAESPAAAE